MASIGRSTRLMANRTFIIEVLSRDCLSVGATALCFIGKYFIVLALMLGYLIILCAYKTGIGSSMYIVL